MSNEYRSARTGRRRPRIVEATLSDKARPADAAEVRRVGLCVTCIHRREVPNRRGSVFYLCRLSQTDPAFPRYPRLPVLSCPGYEHER